MQKLSHNDHIDLYRHLSFCAVGGFFGCYAVLIHSGVMGNAQTVNLIELLLDALRGDLHAVLLHLGALVLYVLGTMLTVLLPHWWGWDMHYVSPVITAAAAVAVAFLPETLNTTANAVVSFVCAMQVQTFRKVRGHAYASTMCIGNMRSGTEALCAYFHTRDKEILHKALTYFGVVLLFALGAGVGSTATLHWGAGTIWLSCGLLTVSFLIMFIHDEEQKLNE